MDTKQLLKKIKNKRKPKTFKAKWSREMAEDLSIFYSMDINGELEKSLVKELENKLKNEDINKIFKL